MRLALVLIRQLYSTPDGVIGGPLHAQLDDMNLYDDQAYNFEPIDYTLPKGYEWEDEASLRATCDALRVLLFEGMSEQERLTVVGTFHAERRNSRDLV